LPQLVLIMLRNRQIRCAVASVIVLAAWESAQAALPIDLGVAAETNAPPGSMQEWGRVLSEMDLARLRLRGARPGDQPAVETILSAAGKRYVVLAVLTRRDELVFPGSKFRRHERAALKAFLQELPRRVDEAGIQRGPFNLPMPEFEKLLLDLSITVDESTKGQRPVAVVAAITSRIKTPLKINSTARSELIRAEPLGAEWKGLTAGTALAATLRAAGLAALPVESGDGSISLRVVSIASDQPAWPVGWKPSESPKVVAAAMYKYTNVEIENYTLARALEAMAPHLGLPLVFDERTLARRGIDPATNVVRFPAEKTYIRRAVDRILSQGRLAGELRVDEAGGPFYWATQHGPESPRAMELPRAGTEK
jgi:hypothetical protein